MDLSGNNVFLYWMGKEYRLIQLLRRLIYLHAGNCTVHLLTCDNVRNYIDDLPTCFDALCPAHQADIVRVYVVYKYGGIWLDSDTIAMEPLDALFDLFREKDGFFVWNGEVIINGIFGSKPHTELFRLWKTSIQRVLSGKGDHLSWREIGADILTDLYLSSPHIFDTHTILPGLETVIPSPHNTAVKDLLETPYEEYPRFERSFQPVVVLYNVIYKMVESDTEFRAKRNILNYFIDKSIRNRGLCADLEPPTDLRERDDHTGTSRI